VDIVKDSIMKFSNLAISRTRIGIKLVLKYLLAPIGVIARGKMGIRVLFYHRVNDHNFADLGMVSRELSVPTKRFDRQMAYLSKRGYHTLKLEEFHQILLGHVPMDKKAILLTFDDGYADNLEHASPILKKYGFNAVVFPVSELIGNTNSVWPMGDPEHLGQFMDTDQLKEWLSAGHEIGSHTCNHPILTHLDEGTLQDELKRSRQVIEDDFDVKCTSLAYPGGDVDERVSDAASRAGYELGFTTRSGVNFPGVRLTQLYRTEVSISDTHLIFILKLRGFFDWLGVRDTVAYRSALRLSHKGLMKLTRTKAA
jgi:peptidoglycan/xylan/chitin deacetylase (PgdA/CDA1 family)